MICMIEAFKNTSFTTSNIPDSAQVLYSNFTPVPFPDCALLQNKYLATLRIATTFEQIDGVDYIVVIKNNIEKTFYFVTSIKMLNENCAELGLMMDAVTTVGINNINIVSGWATRCHTSTDNLFDNDLAEPFTPRHELVLDKSGILKPSAVPDNKDLDVVGATFNVEGDYSKAIKFISGDNYVTTPVCPEFETPVENTSIKMNVLATGFYENKLPETYLFESTKSVKDGLYVARALGLDNGISCSYRIPKEYYLIKTLQGNSLISYLTNQYEKVDSGIPFKFSSTYKPFNNKCYVLWNTFTLMSTCSGERADYTAKEVYENVESGNFTVNVFADLSPNGSPYFSPFMYLGSNNVWQTAIKGMPWQNQPVAYDRQSGWYIQNQSKVLDWNQYVLEQNQASYNLGMSSAKSTVNGVSRMLTGDVVGGGVATADALIDYNVKRRQMEENQELHTRRDNFNYNTAQVYAPQVTFPRNESIQNFLGNFCYVTRTRLHEEDLRRLDTFFNMYGYAVDEPVTKSMFNSRKLFNYIECNNLDITVTSKDTPLYIRDLITQQLSNGVRIWHTKPSNNLFYVKNEVVS